MTENKIMNHNNHKKNGYTNITGNSCLGVSLKKSFLSYCEPALKALNSADNPIYFDAFFSIIDHQLKYNDNYGILKDLSSNLYYFFLENKINIPQSLKISYARYSLLTEKKYSENIFLYESVLGNQKDPNNFFQAYENYNYLGMAFYLNKDYQGFRQTSAQVLNIWEDDLTAVWNHAYANIMCENYGEDILKTMKKVYEISPENKKNMV